MNGRASRRKGEQLVEKLDLREVPFALTKTGGMMGRCAFVDAVRMVPEVIPDGRFSGRFA